MKAVFGIVLAVALVLPGCSIYNSVVYRPDIAQGNFLDDEAIAQLSEGMTPEQVRYVMGSPMLVDQFTPNRWYYTYHYQDGYGDIEQRTLSLTFDNGRLSQIEQQ